MTTDIGADEARRLTDEERAGLHGVLAAVSHLDHPSIRAVFWEAWSLAAPDLAATVERLTAQRDEAVRLLREVHPMHPQPDICPACAFLATIDGGQP